MRIDRSATRTEAHCRRGEARQVTHIRRAPFVRHAVSLVLQFLLVCPRGGQGATLRFGPALNADPGAGEPFSLQNSEFDMQPGLECPYPPCRPLRHDLQLRQAHDQQLHRQQQKLTDGGVIEQPKEQTEYPPKLNRVRGGGDCGICNQVLIGEGLNPANLNLMRRGLPHWLAISQKIMEAKSKDIYLKQHSVHVIECFHAFDRLTCTVEDSNDT